VRMLAIVALSLMATTAALPAQAATSPVSGFVAVTTGTGSMQISSFGPDGSHERRLTAGPADHHYPSMSADGRHLLYVGNDADRDEIYSLDLTHPGAASQQVTAPPLIAESPSWAPDGHTIAFSGILLGWTSYQIFTAGADGSRPRQVTQDVSNGSSQPVFSPDGSHIAYINGRAREDRIWVMNVDGSGARPLTPGPLDAYPAWLDDSTVVFARQVPGLGHSRIMSVSLDGSERTLSPGEISLIEPRPLPDRRSYGATEQVAGALRLVTVVRSDGAALDATADSTFEVNPIPVATSDGSVFTMEWILGSQAPPSAMAPLLLLAVGAAGLWVVGLAAWVIRRRGRRKTSVC
jgi:dipeptidyl aminopeptidase/acylaminoacyl peptidase